MSILGVNGALAGAYQYANRTQKTTANGASFMEQLQKTGETAETSKVGAYTEYLKQRYGAGVSIQNVGKDQSSIDNIGAGTAGTGNVVIASNILEQMANDPEKAAYYEKKIQDYFNYSLPQTQAFMAAVGHKITSSGVIIHEDGTVTYYLSGEESPEKKAQVEAEQKAKQEKKAAQRQENLKRSQEMAEERRQWMEITYRKQMMAEVLANRTTDAGKVAYAGTPEIMSSAIAAYEMSAFTVPGILK